MAQQEYPVSPAEANMRLDLFLTNRLALSRAQVKRLLGSGKVLLNGHPISEKQKGLLLRVGSTLTVPEVQAESEREVVARPDLPLEILAQGEGWLIIDKPAGQATHPLSAEETDTALNAVAGRFPEIQGVGEAGLRSGVVHRLDVDTSGTLCFATEARRWKQLREAFQSHTTKKVYRAIVAGQLKGAGTAHALLHVARHSPARVGVVDPTQGKAQYPAGTRECSLSYRALQVFTNATLAEVELQTGFLHQIRVMMVNLGHPVLGDRTYAPAEVAEMAPRQMLHASYLRVASGIEARAADPADFAGVLSRLR